MHLLRAALLRGKFVLGSFHKQSKLSPQIFTVVRDTPHLQRPRMSCMLAAAPKQMHSSHQHLWLHNSQQMTLAHHWVGTRPHKHVDGTVPVCASGAAAVKATKEVKGSLDEWDDSGPRACYSMRNRDMSLLCVIFVGKSRLTLRGCLCRCILHRPRL